MDNTEAKKRIQAALQRLSDLEAALRNMPWPGGQSPPEGLEDGSAEWWFEPALDSVREELDTELRRLGVRSEATDSTEKKS